MRRGGPIFGKVYLATNLLNGKQYVGITQKTMERRKYEHAHSQGSQYFARAIRKHGAANFSWRVIATALSWTRLLQLEIDYIAHCGTRSPKGYNCTNGGDGQLGVKFTKKTRLKLSASIAAVVRTPEARARASEQLKGLWKTEDYRRKQAAGAAPVFASKKYRKGISLRTRALWANPSWRQKTIVNTRKGRATPESYAKRCRAQQINGNTPEMREKRRQIRLREWADPAMRAKRLAGLQNQVYSPARSSAAKTGWVKRRTRVNAGK